MSARTTRAGVGERRTKEIANLLGRSVDVRVRGMGWWHGLEFVACSQVRLYELADKEERGDSRLYGQVWAALQPSFVL